jgi:hypothetical protein
MTKSPHKGNVPLTRVQSLRSRVRGNAHARFCNRGVRGDPGIDCNRWARALYRRAGELQRTGLPSPQPEVDDTPYADSPIPGVAPKWIKMIHGNPFIIYDGLLTMAHERGLRKLTARFVSVTDARWCWI